MKLEPNMEIDKLLHRHARHETSRLVAATRNASSGGDGGGGAPQEPHGVEHLDADELSAYAENALPAASRARYTSHLADCDACRKLITELVLSSGVAAELDRETETQTPASQSTWGAWLASLFAPRKLAYAASVLALVGVAAIAFMVFRGGRPMRFENSENQQKNVSPNSNTPVPSATVAPVAPGLVPESNVNAAPFPTVAAQDQTAKPETSTDGTALPLGGVAQPKPADAEVGKTEQGPALSAPAVSAGDQPTSTARQDSSGRDESDADDLRVENRREQEPAPPPPAEFGKQKKEADARDLSENVPGLAGRRAPARGNVKTAEAQQSRAQQSANEERAAATPRAKRKMESISQDKAGGAVASKDAGEDRANKLDAEARRVGGKNFVRRGGAWVDTAYGSQATTNMSRGSEQYRALAADEPGLRDIVNQLGGEVVIVWKGRAYRIH